MTNQKQQTGTLQLYYGPDIFHLSESFIRDHQEILQNPAENLYLVNDVRRVTWLKEHWILQQSPRVAGSLPFQSTSRFFGGLYEQLNIPSRLLTWFEKSLIIRQILIQRKPQLLYFMQENRAPAAVTIDSLLNFIERIRIDNADQSILGHSEDRLALSVSDKLMHDIHLIYQDYLSSLSRHFMDEAALLKQVAAGISKGFWKTYFPEVKNIYIEDISQFKNLHFDFFNTLKNFGVNIHYLMPCGKNPEIYSHKDRLFSKVRHGADHVHGYLDNRKLSDSLFQIKSLKFNFKDKIQIVPAVNRLQETELLAAHLKTHIIDHKLPASEIGITGPQIQKYQPILETVFNRYGIPVSFQSSFSLVQSEMIQTIMIVLEMISENYPLTAIYRILKSHFFGYRASLKNIGVLENLHNFRVKNGKKEILSYLDYILEKLNAGEDVGRDRSGEISSFEELKKAVLSLFDDLKSLEKSHTPRQWVKYIYRLIDKHQFTHKTISMHGKNAIGIAQLNLAALEKLMESLKQWADITADKRMSVTDFYEILLFIVQQMTFSRKNPSKFGVQVFPLRQTSLKPYKILYVMGMEDGVFPKSESGNFAHLQYFPGRLRPYLLNEDLYRDRELFLLLLQNPAELIRFSYPKTEKDRPVLPSVFLRELARISGDNLEITGEKTLISRADILESLTFHKDLQQKEGLELSDADEAMRPFIDENQLDRLQFSLRVVESRENIQTNSRWEGKLSEDQIFTNFAGRIFKEKAFSPTELERFAHCPMIYFFERILGVESVEEADVFLSRLDRGQIVHNILYRFYAEHPEDKRNLKKLLQISEQELSKIPLASGLFRDFEFEYFLGNEDVNGLMKAFWEYEQQIQQAYATRPMHFEFSFGLPAGTPAEVDPVSTSHPLQVDSYCFRGKVDRIEIADDGSLLVVDYKTGAYPSIRDMWVGERLQLPLYLRAVYQVLQKKYPSLKMSGGAFYSLKSANDIEKKIAFADQHFTPEGQKISASARFPNTLLGDSGKPLSLEQFLDHVIQQATRYIDRIREGEFRHTSQPQHCSSWDGSSCPYRAVCKLNSFKQAVVHRETSGKL